MPNRLLTTTLTATMLLAACDGPKGPSTQTAPAAKKSDAPAPTAAPTTRPADPQPEPAPAANAQVPLPAGDAPLLRFDLPEGWESRPPSSRMRQAEYLLPVEDGEPLVLAVFYLGGSIDANIDRWRGQFKDADGGAVDAEQSPATEFEANGLTGKLVRIRGGYQAPPFMGGGTIDDALMLAAGIEDVGQNNWYLRVVGPTEQLEPHAEAFEAFVRSARR